MFWVGLFLAVRFDLTFLHKTSGSGIALLIFIID